MLPLPALQTWFRPHWRSLVIIIWPLLLLPLLLLSGTKEARCGYVVLVMAVFWMTEAVPLAITSLMPVMLFPLLGVMSTDAVCIVYLKETNMLSIAGLMVAIAIEHCELHKRIALKVLLLVGTSPRLLMLGFMLNTMFLSMWISNTATAAMMVPIVQAVLSELKQSNVGLSLNSSDTTGEKKSENSQVVTVPMDSLSGMSPDMLKREEIRLRKIEDKKFYQDTICYYLGIAYAANIGGTGTVTGTSTNLIFLGIFGSAYPEGEGVNFASWMLFNVPLMLINTILAWLWLQIFYMGLLTGAGCGVNERGKSEAAAVRRLISRRYDELGALTWHQANVLALFILLVLLWFFRQPEFIPGWAQLLPAVTIKDTTPAMCIVFLLFVLPSNLDFLKFNNKERKTSPSLLTWSIVNAKLPWGVVLLLGGGFAMAEATQVSGLSAWLGNQLVGLAVLPTWLVVAIICLMATFMTEVCSNSAVANILLPVLAQMARSIRAHPVYLMMPATLCCSYSFMLPIATPTNAIIAEATKLKHTDMMRAGFVMNLITVLMLLLAFNSLGTYVFDLSHYPEWAEEHHLSKVTLNNSSTLLSL